MRTRLFIFFVLVLFSTQLFGQVTIGSGIPPHSDALLDLKENPDDSSTKGLLMPRVTLKSKSSPSPLTSHVKGMFVYNIADIDDKIYSGCYYNTGTEWMRIETNSQDGSGSVVAYIASNGLNLADDNVKLGGSLSEPTSINGINSTNKLSFSGTGRDAINFIGNTLSIDADNKRVGLGTNTPLATLDVRGTVKITGNGAFEPSAIVGRSFEGSICPILPGVGLSLSNGKLNATAYAYNLNYTISSYNVTTQTVPIKPGNSDYTVWVSGRPAVGASNFHVVLPTKDVNSGRVINVVASAGELRIGVEGLKGGNGWITSYNGNNATLYTIPDKGRASFQYIGNVWHPEGTWVVMMKDFK